MVWKIKSYDLWIYIFSLLKVHRTSYYLRDLKNYELHSIIINNDQN